MHRSTPRSPFRPRRRQHLRGLVFLAALTVLGAPPSLAGERPADQLDPDPGPRAVVETTAGTMVFELYADRTPKTVENFRRLVAEDFYDGQPFYRVVAGHVIQAGDGGENEQPTVPAEFGVEHVEGTLGLARDVDPDSGSTEIYVCLEPRPHLDGRYAAFGGLVEGRDVLHAIGSAPVNEKWLDGEIAYHEPVEPVTIVDVRIVDAASSATAPSAAASSATASSATAPSAAASSGGSADRRE